MTRDETIGTALESPKLKIAVKNMALLVPHNIPLSKPYGFKLKEYPKNKLAFLTVETRGAELLRWFQTGDGKTKLIGNSYEIF